MTRPTITRVLVEGRRGPMGDVTPAAIAAKNAAEAGAATATSKAAIATTAAANANESAASAGADRVAAQGARDTSVAARDAAIAARDAATSARDAAVTARNAGVDARDVAVAKAGEAGTSAQAAGTAKGAAELAAGQSEAARTTATTKAAEAAASAAGAASAVTTGMAASLGLTSVTTNGSAQDAAFAAFVAQWAPSVATDFGIANPKVTSIPLRFRSGHLRLASSTAIVSPGTGTVIKGDGASTRISGLGIVVNQNKSEVSDLTLMGAPLGAADRVGLTVERDARRAFMSHNIRIRERTIGLKITGKGAQDNYANGLIELCGIPLVINGDNPQIINYDLVSPGGTVAADLTNAQGCKFTHVRGLGRLLLRGRANICVENYFNATTFTQTKKCYIYGVAAPYADANGRTVLPVATKIGCHFEPRGPIFINGEDAYENEPRYAAYARLSLASGSSGQVDSIMGGITELLPAPVPYAGSLAATTTGVAAAINAGTGSHGHTAEPNKTSLTIFAPIAQGSLPNGRPITALTSGGLTMTSPSFVGIVFDAPHDFVDGEDVEFAPNTGSTYQGKFAVRAVESSTAVVVEAPYIAGVVGQGWRPHRLIKEQPGMLLSDTALWSDILTIAEETTDTTLTIDVPFASFPTLPTGWAVTVDGWDIILEAMDTNATRVNDQFFLGGNYNSILIKAAFNCTFGESRLKKVICIDTRGNPAFQSNRITFKRPGRGRASDAMSDVVVYGARTGWGSFEYCDDTPGIAPGGGFWSLNVPNKLRPMIGGKPQLNEYRLYEDKIVETLGGEIVRQIDDTSGILADLKVSRLANAVNKLEVLATTTAVGRVLIRQTGDAAGGMSFRAGTGGFSFEEAAGARVMLLRPAAGAVSYLDMVAPNNTVGPAIQAASSGSGDVIPLRLSGKNGGPVKLLTALGLPPSTIATLPLASLVGANAMMAVSDGAPPNPNLPFVITSGGAWRWLSNGATVS